MAAGITGEKIWIDGELVDWQDANVHILTHTLHYGLGVFEGIRCYSTDDGRSAVFRLPEHAERFLRSAELTGLPLELDQAAIEAAIVETVRANPGSRAVKISAYLPAVEVDVVPQDTHVAVAIAAYDPVEDGVKR